MTAEDVAPKAITEIFRLLRGSGFIFGCRVIGAGLTLVAQLLLARWMGADQLGIYVLAFSWCLLLASVSTLGFIPGAVRFIGEGLASGDTSYAKAFVAFGSRCILLTSAGISLAGILALYLAGELATQTPLIIGLSMVPVFAFLHFLGGVGNGYSRFGLGFLPTSVFRPLVFCMLIAVVYLSGVTLDAKAAMAIAAVAVCLVAAPTAIYAWTRVVIRSGSHSAAVEPRKWITVSASLMIPTLFTGYFPEVVIILTGMFLPGDQLAILHISFRLAMLIAFVLQAVDAFIGPQIARAYAAGDRQKLEDTVHRATRLRFWTSCASVLFFAITGRWLLGLFGPEFVGGFELLMILAGGLLVQGSVGPVVRLIGISRHQDSAIVVFATALITVVVLIGILVPLFGAMGAATAAALVMAMWALWMRHLTVKHLQLRPQII